MPAASERHASSDIVGAARRLLSSIAWRMPPCRQCLSDCQGGSYDRVVDGGMANQDIALQTSVPVKKFIDAVRKRPALWDSRCDDYKDRVTKKDGWIEVCEVMYADFAEYDEQERAQLEREVQLKWKNIRDAYVRHIRTHMDKPRRSFKSYIYGDQLAFLEKVINPRARTRFRMPRPVKDDEEELTHDDILELAQYHNKTEVEEATEEEEEEEMVANEDPLRVETDRASYDNDDMDFFKSMLPTLNTLKTEQKLKFRIDVLELLMTYHQAASQ